MVVVFIEIIEQAAPFESEIKQFEGFNKFENCPWIIKLSWVLFTIIWFGVDVIFWIDNTFNLKIRIKFK